MRQVTDPSSEVLWCLDRFDLLKQLSERERSVLRERVQILRYHKGDTIYLPGDPGDTVYFLTRGEVKLSHLESDGNRLTLRICGPGEPFGETALSGADRRTLIAEALDDVELCAIDKNDLIRFAEKNSVLSLGITKLVGEHYHELEARLEDLIFKDVQTRLARALYRLSQRYGVRTASGIRLQIELTHEDLAHLIGSVRETTSATLGVLAEEGLIKKGRQQLMVLDLDGLRARAQLDKPNSSAA